MNEIERRIFSLRGHKVMLDSDLAEVYGVGTKALNQAVRRNPDRFPSDFLLRLTSEEADSLRSQIVTSKAGRGGRRYLPYVFTEHGAVMLASVLNSAAAVAASIQVVRAFVRLRTILATHKDLARKLDALEQKVRPAVQGGFRHHSRNARAVGGTAEAADRLPGRATKREDVMHEPQHIRTGDLVHVRRQRWRVVDVRAYDQCQLLALAGIEPGNRGLERRFLTPFEAVAALDREASLQFVRPQRWRRACRALLADDAPAAGLRAARSARIDLLPHQLEPALAVLRGHGSRVLLADDVGLGKTIQAGLIIAELRARGMAERVLIVTPAGLRDQWAAELSARFDITASIVDFRDVRHRVAALPAGVNPWSTVPIAIASIDYVKRADVLRSVVSCRWDVLVVDEAHGAAGDSDRHAAAAALGARAACVLLLTATPHNGDVHAFHALCRTGAHADPLLVFRRTRTDVRLGGGRRVHRLHVRPSAAEARMHTLLDAFTRAVRAERQSADVWLPLAVLHKRALSSARSLERSVERRLAALDRTTGGDVRQLDLPLADPGGELDPSDDAPAWASGLALADDARERRLLGALADAARAAARHETKLAAIVRLLNRISEPIVIFTEYRDTLLHLREAIDRPVLLLHGGLRREERAAALEAFVSGHCQILLATDAAGEGLNLHQRCRIVINLELPWNPMRLEQRIGRVDRIGQRRTVHVFHLVARETNETRVLEQLKARIARAQQDIAAANPLEGDDPMMARLVIEGPAE